MSKRILPTLFNTEMVKAILQGQKRETRRAIKPQPLFFTGRHYVFDDATCPKKWEDCDDFISTAPYQPGDTIYVRETWAEWTGGYVYRADVATSGYPLAFVDSWRPSIHMPKEAARIFLRVTDVRVERLQTIDCQGILAEGLNTAAVRAGDMDVARKEFAALWNCTVPMELRPAYGWDANPFVWVYCFEPCAAPASW